MPNALPEEPEGRQFQQNLRSFRLGNTRHETSFNTLAAMAVLTNDRKAHTNFPMMKDDAYTRQVFSSVTATRLDKT